MMGEIAEMMLNGEMTEDGEYIGPIPREYKGPFRVSGTGHIISASGVVLEPSEIVDLLNTIPAGGGAVAWAIPTEFGYCVSLTKDSANAIPLFTLGGPR